jgi:hypothetical protein
MSKIEELVNRYDFSIRAYIQYSDPLNKQDRDEARSALLSEYRRMESDLATLLPVKEQLEKVDYTIEQEGEEIVVECVHCGFPIDEGHADDCPNNLGFQLASERKAHRWHDENEQAPEIILELDDDINYVAKKIDGKWKWTPLPTAPESRKESEE